jgi:hypothetical protein
MADTNLIIVFRCPTETSQSVGHVSNVTGNAKASTVTLVA